MVQQLHLIDIDCGNSDQFTGEDSYSKFRRNLENKPEDWVWRSKPVQYSLNSQLYRAPEWDTIDWNNSVILFGDSMSYGVGVNDTDVITYRLSQQLSMPVINLSQSGVGIHFFLANSIILKEAGINPKAVIYLWPDRIRQTEFVSDKKILSYGPWNLDKSWMNAIAIRNKHGYHYNKYLMRTLRLLWECPIVEATWYEELADMNCSLLPFKDTARDGTHPGPITHELSANIIFETLSKQLR